MESPKSYSQLFKELHDTFLALRTEFLQKLNESSNDGDSDGGSYTDFAKQMPEWVQIQLRHATARGLIQREIDLAIPSIIAASRLTLHAIRRGNLRNAGELCDAERLFADSADDNNVFNFWNKKVMPVMRRLNPENIKKPLEVPGNLLLCYAEACRGLERATGSTSIREQKDDPDFQPADWFRRHTEVPQDRLRQAALPKRKGKRVRKDKSTGAVRYSAADARLHWPDDMNTRPMA
jgi:hypothetical protein